MDLLLLVTGVLMLVFSLVGLVVGTRKVMDIKKPEHYFIPIISAFGIVVGYMVAHYGATGWLL
jgi:hypothetical protein